MQESAGSVEGEMNGVISLGGRDVLVPSLLPMHGRDVHAPYSPPYLQYKKEVRTILD